jgi:hypothetical protein
MVDKSEKCQCDNCFRILLVEKVILSKHQKRCPYKKGHTLK